MNLNNRLETVDLRDGTSLMDRLTSVVSKVNDLGRIASQMPINKPELLPHFQAMLANEMSRTQQFAWKLLKDVERSLQAKTAAPMQHQDAK